MNSVTSENTKYLWNPDVFDLIIATIAENHYRGSSIDFGLTEVAAAFDDIWARSAIYT